MYKALALVATITVSLSMVYTTAEAAENGPVITTVNSNSYKVFYSTIDYFSIVTNYVDQNSSPPDATNKAPTRTTAYTPFVAGTYEIPGLGSFKGMMQPWWNPSDNTAAKNAALAWYNQSGWPINDGVQFPNAAGLATPRFAYATGDGGARVYWASYDNTGSLVTGNNLVTDTGVSYALAGISQ